MLQPATEVGNFYLNPILIMAIVSEMVGMVKENSYTGILKPTVLCDSMNQAASYWSSIPYHRDFFRDWGPRPPTPLATPLIAG